MSAKVQADDATSIERASRYRPGNFEPRHTVEITDPADFSTAVEAAETLGLSLAEVHVQGSWEAHPDAGCGLGRNFYVDIAKAGRKWFHLKFEDGIVRARPRRSDVTDDGSLRLLFS